MWQKFYRNINFVEICRNSAICFKICQKTNTMCFLQMVLEASEGTGEGCRDRGSSAFLPQLARESLCKDIRMKHLVRSFAVAAVHCLSSVPVKWMPNRWTLSRGMRKVCTSTGPCGNFLGLLLPFPPERCFLHIRYLVGQHYRKK